MMQNGLVTTSFELVMMPYIYVMTYLDNDMFNINMNEDKGKDSQRGI